MKKLRAISYKPLPQLKGPSGLADEARAFSEFCLRSTGEVHPTMMAVTPRGLIIHCPSSLTSEGEKEAFATECRLLLIASEATMCAMVLESWMVGILDGKVSDLPPFQSPDRVEVVTICAESRTTRQFLILPIQRSALGVYTGLGGNAAPPGLDAQGRFTGMIQRAKGKPGDAGKARAALLALGLSLTGSDSPYSRN